MIAGSHCGQQVIKCIWEQFYGLLARERKLFQVQSSTFLGVFIPKYIQVVSVLSELCLRNLKQNHFVVQTGAAPIHDDEIFWPVALLTMQPISDENKRWALFTNLNIFGQNVTKKQRIGRLRFFLN